MSKLSIRAFVLVGMMLLASASPLAQFTKADPEIELQVDMAHMILIPGESMNLTLTIENNGSSIETYDVETSTAGLSSLWTAVPTSNSVSNVLPTYNSTTTIVVQLGETATPSDNGMFTIFVNESDGGASSSIDVYVSVAIVYNPHLDASGVGDQGLLAVEPGQSVDVSITVSNHGSVMDSYLLDVGEEPDLTGWWENYSSSGGSNTSNSTPSWSTSVSDVLLFGNSYTSANGLSSMLQELLRSANSPSNTSDFTTGGWKISDHWDDVNTSGSQQNVSLATGVWDTVVVQDQSQIPGFPRTNSDWLASKNGSIHLGDRIDSEGAAMMLMGFVMFFVFSVVLSLSPEQLATAQAQNISVLSYLANVHESPLISYMGPLVAVAAITSSYFGHFLGAHEGLVGLIKSRSGSSVSTIEKVSLAFIVVTTWIVAVVNPSILGMIETMGAPMIAAILFLMPVFAMNKVPAMAKYKTSAPVQIFTALCGLAAISSVIYGAL